MAKPLVGLVTGLNKEETYLTVNNHYIRALETAGALPVVLPLTDDMDELAEMVERVDGVCFTGGGDIGPELFGEYTLPACGAIDTTRDAMEIPLARLLADRPDKPTLAVCRGEQVLNTALGGTLYQDIFSQRPGVIAHRQKHPDRFAAHPVTIVPGTLLASIVGDAPIGVNTLHHQAVKDVSPRLIACATAPDGICEAVELPGHPFYLGVQWHPERMWWVDDKALAIFKAFVAACTKA